MDSFCSIPLCVGRKACLPPSLAPGSSLASMGPQLCGEPSLSLTTGVSTSRVRLVDALGRQGGAHRLTPRTGSHRARGCLLRPRAARWPAWAAAGPEGPSWCCSLPGCDPPSRGGCPVGPGLGGCPVRAHRWCWLGRAGPPEGKCLQACQRRGPSSRDSTEPGPWMFICVNLLLC